MHLKNLRVPQGCWDFWSNLENGFFRGQCRYSSSLCHYDSTKGICKQESLPQQYFILQKKNKKILCFHSLQPNVKQTPHQANYNNVKTHENINHWQFVELDYACLYVCVWEREKFGKKKKWNNTRHVTLLKSQRNIELYLIQIWKWSQNVQDSIDKIISCTSCMYRQHQL